MVSEGGGFKPFFFKFLLLINFKLDIIIVISLMETLSNFFFFNFKFLIFTLLVGDERFES